MDEAGFIPVAVALNYPNVAAVCAVYEDVLHRLQENSTNSILEVDLINETIRLKIGWEMVKHYQRISEYTILSIKLLIVLIVADAEWLRRTRTATIY